MRVPSGVIAALFVAACSSSTPVPAAIRFTGPTRTSDTATASDGIPAPVTRFTLEKNGETVHEARKAPSFATYHGNGYQDGATITGEIKAQPNPKPPQPPPPVGPGEASISGMASKGFTVTGSGNKLLTMILRVVLNEADAVSALPSAFTITGTLNDGATVLRTATSNFTVAPDPGGKPDQVQVTYSGGVKLFKANNVLDFQLDQLTDTITVAADTSKHYTAKVVMVGSGKADGHTHTKVTTSVRVK